MNPIEEPTVEQPVTPSAITFTQCKPMAVVIAKGRSLKSDGEDVGRNFIVYERGSDGSVLMQSRKLGRVLRIAAEEFAHFKPRTP